MHLAELQGALIFINAEAALLGRPKAACRPTRIDCLHRIPDNHLLDMLALRTFERQKVGMGGTRFDPGQHHPALTLRAAGPLDGKQGWTGMTIGFMHDASLRWAGAERSQSPVGADMRDGDGASMLFRFAESVVNIAHIGKVK
jgi:hypothetical protein